MASLDPAQVPASLRALIPLAEQWGIGDDYDRDAAVEGASDAERKQLVEAVAMAPDELWTWLAAPASEEAPPSAEYVRFTCLTMAADLARVLIAERS